MILIRTLIIIIFFLLATHFFEFINVASEYNQHFL